MSGRVVISSLTGEPMPWDDDETAGTDAAPRPVLPKRVAEDRPAPGEDESNDRRLRQDVPPHWGRGT